MISILGNGLCSSKIYCFWFLFVNFYTSRRQFQRIAAIMLQTIPSFYAKCSEKDLSISSNTYEKYIVRKDDCIAQHNDRQDVFSTRLRISYYTTWRNWRVATQIGYVYFHVSTLPLSINPVQVPLQRKNYCKEWKCFWQCAESNLI